MERPTVYLTNEQLQRLAALSLDALVGIQLTTDDHDDSSVTYEFVPLSSKSHTDLYCGSIQADGHWEDQT